MEDKIDLCLKRIEELEKRLEYYYNILKINNELDFVLNGTYLLEEEMENIIQGLY